MDRIGLCWGTVAGASIAEMIEVAPASGYESLMISPLQWRRNDVAAADLRRRLADAGLRIGVLDGIGRALPGMPVRVDVSPEAGSVLLFDAAEAFRVAAALAIPCLNVPHYLGDPATPLTAFIDALGAFAARAAAEGVRVGLEFIPGTGIPDLAAALDIAEAVAAPNLGVTLDTWHFARGGGTLAELGAVPVGRIMSVQISDRIAPPAGTPYVAMSDRALPGQGELPLAETIAILRRIAPGVSLDLEVFNARLRALGHAEAARQAAAALRAVLERAG